MFQLLYLLENYQKNGESYKAQFQVNLEKFKQKKHCNWKRSKLKLMKNQEGILSILFKSRMSCFEAWFKEERI